MKKLLITTVALAGMALAACSSNQSEAQNADSVTKDSTMADTVSAQAPGDSVRLADSAINRADHVKSDTIERPNLR
ncbi:MAG: hypothetical protein REI78_05455 [Pedobacter sp.]|nr:hypothetical protein [Pedobacter sp.]MDQ8052447.1 hypothetical protein [Pedobacter sp.]